MATATVQLPAIPINIGQGVETRIREISSKTHDVTTTLYYYKDPGDESEPEPSYVG
jgi:hypothetical protein